MTRFGNSFAWLAGIGTAIVITLCDAPLCCAEKPSTNAGQLRGHQQQPSAHLNRREGSFTASSHSHVSDRRSQFGTIDANTRWGFRVITPATVSSAIVRLGDVVRPLDPDLVAWQRLRRAPIALLPLGSQPMTIQRDRLERAILDAEATPLAIDWLGPDEIRVRFEKRATPLAKTLAPAIHSPVSPASTNENSAPAVARVSHEKAIVDSESSRGVLTESTVRVRRIDHWVTLSLSRMHPDIDQEYRIEVPQNQPEFESFRSISGVNDIQPIGPVREGECRFRLKVRTPEGTVDTELTVTLTPHPMAVFPRTSLRMGHRLTRRDLELQPVREEELNAEHVLDFDDVIGMELQGSARPGRPLLRNDLSAPTLIHRGDLIEVRVMGGGIVVTTNAKAHGDGSASDLIEIETLSPRKRLVARVLQPGLVEIVTRAPKVGR